MTLAGRIFFCQSQDCASTSELACRKKVSWSFYIDYPRRKRQSKTHKHWSHQFRRLCAKALSEEKPLKGFEPHYWCWARFASARSIIWGGKFALLLFRYILTFFCLRLLLVTIVGGENLKLMSCVLMVSSLFLRVSISPFAYRYREGNASDDMFRSVPQYIMWTWLETCQV